MKRDKEEEKALVEIRLSVTEMLIAVSIKKPKNSSELSDTFGRCEYFSVYDSKNNVSEFIQNPYSSELGRAGIQSARFLIEMKIEAVITSFIGLNTLRFFNSLKVKVYRCINYTAQESLGLYFDNKLKEITASKIEQFPQRRKNVLEEKCFKNRYN